MAKKVVATISSGSKDIVKVFKLIKSQDKNSYSFRPKIMSLDNAINYMKKKH